MICLMSPTLGSCALVAVGDADRQSIRRLVRRIRQDAPIGWHRIGRNDVERAQRAHDVDAHREHEILVIAREIEACAQVHEVGIQIESHRVVKAIGLAAQPRLLVIRAGRQLRLEVRILGDDIACTSRGTIENDAPVVIDWLPRSPVSGVAPTRETSVPA